MSTRSGARSTVAELAAGSDLPAHEIMRLLKVAAGRVQSPGALSPDHPLDAAQAEAFQAMVDQRRRGVPLQYLEGSVAFGPIELDVDRRVLIPRPETEQLWDLVVRRLGDDEPGVIVDLCTGSGALALALKHRYPGAAVYGADLSADALDVAAANGAKLGLEVIWLLGDLYEPLPRRLQGRVDLLVANPPYVTAAEFRGLPAEVRVHEPRLALEAGPTGDEVLARIASGAGSWLSSGGLVACEIAEQRPSSALSLFGAFEAEVLEDLAGRPRFVVGEHGPGQVRGRRTGVLA